MRYVKLATLLVLGAAAYWATFTVIGHKPLPIDTSIVQVLAEVSATVLGFSMAALSILSALGGRRLIVNMRLTGHYKNLLGQLFGATASYLITLIVSVISLLLPALSFVYGASLSIAIFAMATALFVFAGRNFYNVMIVLDAT